MYPISSFFGFGETSAAEFFNLYQCDDDDDDGDGNSNSNRMSSASGSQFFLEYIGDFMNLSEDVQVFILTYLDIIDLYRVSLSCKHCAYLVLSNDTDDFLWRDIALRYGIQEGEEDVMNHDFLEPMSPVAASPATPVESSSFRAKLYNLFSSYVSANITYNNYITSSIYGNGGTGSSSTSSTSNSSNSNSSSAGGNFDNLERQKQPPRRLSIVIQKDELFRPNILLKEVRELSGLENLWRRRVRQGIRFHWDPDSKAPDSSLVLSNRNKTVSNNRTSKWDTIRANCPLRRGVVYHWEYVLDSMTIQTSTPIASL